MPNFLTPAMIDLWHNSLAVGANKCSASLPETPKALILGQHPIAPPGKTERDGAIPANRILHVMVAQWHRPAYAST